MVKEQWDYIGLDYLPDTEPVMMYRDTYALWMNPFTGEKKHILVTKCQTVKLK
jgi:hypothetical protein